MSAKDLKVLERRKFEAWNKGKASFMAVVDETYTSDVTFHTAASRDVRGLNDFKQLVSRIFDAFPDQHQTVDDLIVEGEKTVVRYTITGTHKGEFMGVPPTNKKVTTSVIVINRFAGDKIMEAWERYDTLGVIQQLGVIPTPKK